MRFLKPKPGSMAVLSEDRIQVFHFRPLSHDLSSVPFQRKESRRLPFLPRCQKHSASPVPLGYDAEPHPIFYCGLRSIPAFHLNQDDLKQIAALRP